MDEAATPAVEQIAAALSDEHARTAATYALGRIGQIPADAEATIRANVKSDDKMLSTTSLWALARVHPEDKAASARGDGAVDRAAEGSGSVRAGGGRPGLGRPAARSGNHRRRFGKRRSKTRMRRRCSTRWTPWRRSGAPAVPRLIDALKHEKLRGQVVYVLGQIGPAAAPATPALAKLIADKDDRVAHEAILALANIGPGAKDAVPALAASARAG